MTDRRLSLNVGPGVRRCTMCLITRPTSEFSPHPRTLDGVRSRCKVCATKVAHQKRWADVKDARAKDRMKRPTERERDARRRYSKAYKKKHPERIRAASKLHRLKQSGRIEAPASCQACGCVESVLDMHHVDYDRPLDVMWVCKPCHKVLDNERRAAHMVAPSAVLV